MKLWDHTADELMALPLPDLALLVLADFKDGDGWNQRNWMLGAADQAAGHRQKEIINRLAESWAWLNARAFVSWRPDQDTADSRRVTDEGNRALDLGLARLHAAQRLEVDLLPRLVKARRQFLQGDYEEAVFASFRAVEEQVREQARMTAGDLGVKLMRLAFRPDGGSLADQAAEAGNRRPSAASLQGLSAPSRTLRVTGPSTTRIPPLPLRQCCWPISFYVSSNSERPRCDCTAIPLVRPLVGGPGGPERSRRAMVLDRL